MVRFIKIIVIVCGAMIEMSCNQSKVVIVASYPNGKPAIKKIFPNGSDTADYQIFEYYRSGQIFKEAKVTSSQYVDRKVTYFEDGKVKQIDSLAGSCARSVNRCDGTLLHYYANGILRDRRKIENGGFSGLSQFYSHNGILIKEFELKSDTVKDGIYKEYFDDGKLAFLARYKNDTLVDFEYYFSENGDTTKYFAHYKGVINLPYKKWLSGKRTLSGMYNADSSKVLWTWRDSAGRIVKRMSDNLKGKKSMIVPE